MNKIPWNAFRNTVGADLLPVVADPDIKVNPKSSMPQNATIGKIPSIVDKDGYAIGVRSWASREASKADLDKWEEDERLGFGMRGNTLKAITIDAGTSRGYLMQRDLIIRALGNTPSIAVSRVDDQTKGIVLFKSKDSDTFRRTETPYAHLELLGSTKFLVLDAGRIRYSWSRHLEGDLQDLVKAKKFATPHQLSKIFR